MPGRLTLALQLGNTVGLLPDIRRRGITPTQHGRGLEYKWTVQVLTVNALPRLRDRPPPLNGPVPRRQGAGIWGSSNVPQIHLHLIYGHIIVPGWNGKTGHPAFGHAAPEAVSRRDSYRRPGRPRRRAEIGALCTQETYIPQGGRRVGTTCDSPGKPAAFFGSTGSRASR